MSEPRRKQNKDLRNRRRECSNFFQVLTVFLFIFNTTSEKVSKISNFCTYGNVFAYEGTQFDSFAFKNSNATMGIHRAEKC